MNIYILNRLGKTIYVRALRKPSDEPGVLHDVVIEFYAKRPKKIKDTISILRIGDDDSEWFADQNPDAKVYINNHLDWEYNLRQSERDGDMILELAALN